MNMRQRPEDPELDDQQMRDLKTFLSSKTVKELERAKQQLLADSDKDRGSYPEGGVPANTSKTFTIIQELLEEKQDYSGEKKG